MHEADAVLLTPQPKPRQRSQGELTRRLALVLAAWTLSPAAAGAAEPSPGPDVDLGVFASLPPALQTGQTLGATAGLELDVAGPLRLGLRLAAGRASESNETRLFEHTELRAALSAALVLPLDRGELALRLDGGGLWLLEAITRHQSGRLGDTGGGGTQTAWAAGPFVAASLRVRLSLLSGWAAVAGAGPLVSWLAVGEELEGRLGWSGELAASRRF